MGCSPVPCPSANQTVQVVGGDGGRTGQPEWMIFKSPNHYNLYLRGARRPYARRLPGIMERILNYCSVAEADRLVIRNTRQLVTNITLLLWYFKYRGEMHKVAFELSDEWETVMHMYPLEPKEGCFNQDRGSQRKSITISRGHKLTEKLLNLLEELKRRDVLQFDDIYRKFTVEESTAFTSQIGAQWREIE